MIRFENVGLRYGMGPEVLSDISFQIPPGSFQFLTGPSGAGKTTLLRLLFLALKPTRGLINIFGQDASSLPIGSLPAIRRRIGIVFQDFRLLDHLTTYENVALPLRVIGQSEHGYRKDVEELLQWVGLDHRMDAYPPVLSGGEKQRAAIARAVIAQPDLLLADEPTGQRRPDAGTPAAAPVQRVAPARHHGRHRHPRHRPDGPVRARPPPRAQRRQAACL